MFSCPYTKCRSKAAFVILLFSILPDVSVKARALVKQYQKLFGFDDVRLTFEKDAVKAIAKQAF